MHDRHLEGLFARATWLGLLAEAGFEAQVAPFAHSEFAAAQIPGAELLPLETGTHLAFYTHPESDEAQRQAVALLGR